ncbi:SAF domain-containing protein [Actinomadura flavalba]|uniref:SAF domain-containing protein n=1 Tax=Actinomadura flavalba TaxID=1120938 RepID=UPI0003A1FE4B|nr:SAF domain-containing protein [Actinomadura flavalba]
MISRGLALRVARHRRLLATACAAIGAGSALLALRPSGPPTREVLTAARDLPSGTALTRSDVQRRTLPTSVVPAGTLDDATGRTLAGPVRRGEPLTDARVVDGNLLRGLPDGTVAAPVRITDADAARLVRPGDRVDILAVPTAPTADDSDLGPPPDTRADLPRALPGVPSRARLVVTSVPVIAVPRPEPDTTSPQGALIVIATDRAQATTIAAAGPHLSITINDTG